MKFSCPPFICDCTCCDGERDSSETALFDWWSLAHIMGGAVLGLTLYLWSFWTSFVIAMVCSIGFEVVENTHLGTKITGIVCFSENYRGDNFWNSVMDVVCNFIGFTIVYFFKIQSNG